MCQFNIKKILISALAICLLISNLVYADVHVRSYTRSDGTVVKEHYRSDPDGDVSNNWSHVGNINPYTGKAGTKNDNETNISGSNEGYTTNCNNDNNHEDTQHDYINQSSDDILNNDELPLYESTDIDDMPDLDSTDDNDFSIDDADEGDNDDNYSHKNNNTMHNAIEQFTPSKSPYYEKDNDNKSPAGNRHFEEYILYALPFILIAFIFYKIGKHRRNK